MSSTVKYPFSEKMEMVTLAAMLSTSESLRTGLDELTCDHFNSQPSKFFFQAIWALNRTEIKADQFNTVDYLTRNKRVSVQEGANFVAKLDELTLKTSYFDDAVRILKDLHLKRQMMDHGLSLFKEAQKCVEPEHVLDTFQQVLCLLGTTNVHTGNSHIALQLQDYVVELQERRKNGCTMTGYSTGFSELDIKINGINKQQLIVVGARTGQGKTAFALSMINNLLNDGRGVGFFSLEMPYKEINHRLIGIATGVEVGKLMTGDVTTAQATHIAQVTNDLKKANLFVEDPPKCTMQQLRSKARYLVKYCKVDVIVIDYLQFIQAKQKVEHRYIEVSQISNDLKSLAKELNVPIVCLAQLSRRVDERLDKTPQPSDLRESGSIEQDADIILLLKRPYAYDQRKDPNLAEINVAKNRNGMTGMVELIFDAKTMHFKDQSIAAHWSEAQGG